VQIFRRFGRASANQVDILLLNLKIPVITGGRGRMAGLIKVRVNVNPVPCRGVVEAADTQGQTLLNPPTLPGVERV